MKYLVLLAALVACSDAPSAPDAAACPPINPRTPVDVGALTGIANSELSGLAASRSIPNVLWTHGDSGGLPDIYAIDSDASVHGTLHLAGATAIDWEDIAVAPCSAGSCIYVADTGDNTSIRASVDIYEVAEPAVTPTGIVDTTFTRFSLAYPDGPHNMEALFVDARDGAVYGITKTAGLATIYQFTLAQGGAVTAIATLALADVDARVTAADLHVDSCGVELLVRTYDRVWLLSGDADASIASLAAATPRALPAATEPQGEAIAFSADGRRYFTTSEGALPPLWRVDLF